MPRQIKTIPADIQMITPYHLEPYACGPEKIVLGIIRTPTIIKMLEIYFCKVFIMSSLYVL
jgi:hypothetical protein